MVHCPLKHLPVLIQAAFQDLTNVTTNAMAPILVESTSIGILVESAFIGTAF